MLGWVLVAAGLAVSLVAALILLRFRGWFIAWLKGTLGLTAVLVGVLVMAVGWSVLQWQRVPSDGPLHRLSISSAGGNNWRIELRDGETRVLERMVRGDLVELSGRLLVVEAPLGGSTPVLLYRTDSIRGFDPDSVSPIEFNARGATRAGDWIDVWQWERTVPLPLVRAESLYPLWVPTVDGAVFEVILQGNQIVPVPVNAAAEQALEGRE